MASISPPSRRLRWLAALFLLLPGLALGTWIGSRYLVPPGSGLAAAAIALGYGVAGALLLPLAWLIASSRLAAPHLRVGAWVSGLLSLVIVAIIGLGIHRGGVETRRHLEQLYADLPGFEFSIGPLSADGGARFDGVSYRGGNLSVRREGQTCAVAVSGEGRVKLLGALRNLELLAAAGSPGCDAAGDRVAWKIAEARPPDTEGALSISPQCRDAHREAAAVFAAVRELLAAADGSCE